MKDLIATEAQVSPCLKVLNGFLCVFVSQFSFLKVILVWDASSGNFAQSFQLEQPRMAGITS
jgi:hypothetical protein